MKVTVGYVHPDKIHALFVSSLIQLLQKEYGRVTSVLSILSGPKVDDARNELMKAWLEGSDTDYLLMLDTDMIVPIETLERLLAAEKDVIGGLCFSGGYHGAVKPTIFRVEETLEGQPILHTIWDYPPDEVIEVAGTGAACMLISRRCAQAVWDARGKDHPMPWFAHGMHNGVRIGEDIAFCLTAIKCGFGIFVDTGLEVGHIKSHIIGQNEYASSLMSTDHPYYTHRESVPAYQDRVNGNASQPGDRSGAEGVPPELPA